ncbi:MAG: lytic transglycosylase domain-containing protein [Lentisphaeria bacterium]|nr:lytic transglycosylase domain-containing protein [Lentisphaeria bacterium]MBR6481298.1 lytic transglycosylase domain-containing protein [Thermoguttaceae bacterium]
MPYGIRKEGTGKIRISSGGIFSAVFLLVIALLSFAAAAGLWRAGKALISYLSRENRYDKIIVEAGIRNGVDPCLIKAVIWRESKFNAREKGGKGEIGLMQVIPLSAASDWAKAKRFTLPSAGALYDPELNIEVGSWYLGRALRRWRNFRDCVALALCEYNAGLARTKKWQPETGDGDVISRIGIDSTKRYVKDILKRYRKYKEEWTIPQ